MEHLNLLTHEFIGCAMKVHQQSGPGLLENTYEVCLEYELIHKGFKVERQKTLPVVYNSIKLDAGYQIDLLVENEIILELKAGDELASIHEAQLLTYLKLADKKLGLLINFNVKLLKDGIKRMVR